MTSTPRELEDMRNLFALSPGLEQNDRLITRIFLGGKVSSSLNISPLKHFFFLNSIFASHISLGCLRVM